MKKQLVIVPDDHYHKKINSTFLVYEIENGSLIHESPYNSDLNCVDLLGQGRPTFRPYGVTSDEEYLYIVSHKKLGKYNKKTFDYCGLVDIPLYVNTHQVLKNDNIFYVTHTSVNNIGIHGENDTFFNVDTLNCGEKPVSPSHAESVDKFHVNSICDYGGKIYFCLNNLGVYPSQFGYFDKSTYESKILTSAGNCCHDIQIINNKLYTLSTGTGEIIEIDLDNMQTFRYNVVNPQTTYLRGMDIFEENIIFACSNRYSDEMLPINNCFVATFNITDKTISKKFSVNHAEVIARIKVI
jgi:hypothetical protein